MQSKCCVQFILSFAVQYLLHGLPQFIIFGNRSSDLNQLFGYRMNKFNVSGMQTNAAIRIGARKAVFQIAFDGASHFGQLATDLMMTTCFEMNLKQIIAIGVGDKLIG